jgi:hypothetical protein
MLKYSRRNACFKHSILFTVNEAAPDPNNLMPEPFTTKMDPTRTVRRTQGPGPKVESRYSTTSFLTATTLIYAIGAGITAAAGTRLALQLILVKGFKLFSFQLQNPKGSALIFIVTTSVCHDWVIYAPAAFLGCGSRLSGSLSEIEPLFFVTRYRHGSPIHYHRKLIGQKLE